MEGLLKLRDKAGREWMLPFVSDDLVYPDGWPGWPKELRKAEVEIGPFAILGIKMVDREGVNGPEEQAQEQDQQAAQHQGRPEGDEPQEFRPAGQSQVPDRRQGARGQREGASDTAAQEGQAVREPARPDTRQGQQGAAEG